MVAKRFSDPKQVLIFNGQRVLVAIARSALAASQLTGCKVQSVVRTCQGSYVSSGGWYFRYVPDDIDVTLEDLNTLKLQEYDELCEVEREYHSPQQMSRNLQIARGEELAPLKKKSIKKTKSKRKRKTYESTDSKQI